MSKLMTEWTFEMLTLIAHGEMNEVQPFDEWRRDRDDRIREERAEKAATDEAKKAAPVLTYVVHGFQHYRGFAEPSPFFTVPDNVTLLYAGPDVEHAREIAMASSTRSSKVQFSCQKIYYKTRVTTCTNGKPGACQEF